MYWEWDENKNRANRSKHGLSFETASLVFDDPVAVSIPDPNMAEERWRTVGMVGSMVVMVVHTEPELKHGVETGRIVSARKATRRERKSMRKRASERLTAEQQAEVEALAALSDEDIDTGDAPEILDWSGALRGRFYRPVKQQITLRLDADVVAWFKAAAPGGRGYQTEINRVLREHARAGRRLTGLSRATPA